jgi:hypothetical protein
MLVEGITIKACNYYSAAFPSWFVHPMMLTITNQGFLTSPPLQRLVRDHIRSILNDLNIQPMWHPLRQAFWHIVIKKSENIRRRINALDILPGKMPMPTPTTTGLLSGR